MELTPIQRIAIRTSGREYRPYREIAEPTLRALAKLGLLEICREGSPRTRLTEKGMTVRSMLPPEPRPDWHDPAWRKENWKINDPAPVVIEETESRAYGWPLGAWPWSEPPIAG